MLRAARMNTPAYDYRLHLVLFHLTCSPEDVLPTSISLQVISRRVKLIISRKTRRPKAFRAQGFAATPHPDTHSRRLGCAFAIYYLTVVCGR
jgi:hypothetical protein